MSSRRFTMRIVEQVGFDYYYLEAEVSEASLAMALDKAYVLEQEYIKLVEQFDYQTKAARETAKTAPPRTLKYIAGI